jgi:hypothetical protein
MVVSGVSLALLLLLGRPYGLELATRWEQRKMFPLLASFESERELRFWRATGLGHAPGDGTRIDRVSAPELGKGKALKVCTPAGAEFPGVRLLLPGDSWNDWRPFRTLRLAIYRERDPLRLSLRIDDVFPFRSRSDRFNRCLDLHSGWNEVTIPIEEIASAPEGRRLNLQKIRRIVFFLDHPNQSETFFIGRVTLEP